MSAEPFFSIVVPTFSRPDRLAECLASLASLDYPRDRFEVLVVDDGNASPPAEVVERFQPRIDIRLFTQTHAGPAAARNTGAAQARGEYLAFTDDDCRPRSDWLTRLARRCVAAPENAVGGYTVNELTANPYAAVTQMLVDYLYEYYNRIPDDARFLTSNNLAVPIGGFRAIAGFDPSFPLAGGEDRDLCHRWRALGLRMIYAREAVVRHRHELTFRTFWRQHFSYGRGSWRFHRRRTRREERQRRLQPASFYIGLLLFPLRRSQGGVNPFRALLMMVAQVANAAGFFREAFNRDDLLTTS